MKHIGKDFTPPDIFGKVTGKAKFAEDFTAEGMVYARLWTSPMPHARVKSLDVSAALAVQGVVGVLTPDDVPQSPAPNGSILTNEPVYVGDPILAIAAVDEKTAEDALGLVKIELEPLPFAVQPTDSLRPNGPTARPEGNIFTREMGELHWNEGEVERFLAGQQPTAKAPIEWQYGDSHRLVESIGRPTEAGQKPPAKERNDQHAKETKSYD